MEGEHRLPRVFSELISSGVVLESGTVVQSGRTGKVASIRDGFESSAIGGLRRAARYAFAYQKKLRPLICETGVSGNTRFTIVAAHKTDVLPSAHSCFNQFATVSLALGTSLTARQDRHAKLYVVRRHAQAVVAGDNRNRRLWRTLFFFTSIPLLTRSLLVRVSVAVEQNCCNRRRLELVDNIDDH